MSMRGWSKGGRMLLMGADIGIESSSLTTIEGFSAMVEGYLYPEHGAWLSKRYRSLRDLKLGLRCQLSDG